MKSKQLKDSRSKKVSDLDKQVAGLQKELLDLKLQLSVGKVKNARESKLKRRDIAQIKTIIREKELNKDA